MGVRKGSRDKEDSAARLIFAWQQNNREPVEFIVNVVVNECIASTLEGSRFDRDPLRSSALPRLGNYIIVRPTIRHLRRRHSCKREFARNQHFAGIAHL